MSAATGPRGAEVSRLRALWRGRPPIHSRSVWALIVALDALPWPLGEDLLARLFAAASLVKPSRRGPSRRWAARQPDAGPPGRLARAACAFRGRWVARSALLGVRTPDDLRRHVLIRGEEHLTAAPAGRILLGFHLGPPNADVALRVAGLRLAWLGSRRTSPAWSRPAWRPLLDAKENLSPPGGEWFWPGVLYRARRMLLDGGTVFVMADAWSGRELFRLEVPGSSLTVRAGWLTLHQQTGAPVLPVLTHLAGRSQVVKIHPPLPGLEPTDARLETWQDLLGALVRDHVARFPEQCPTLLFPPQLPRRTRL